jgi:trk system potassium uptake protein
MNFIIIGLGNFGASLAKKLTALGHDVIGVDKDMDKVEFFKDTIKNTVSMDITDIHALKSLPLKDCDHVVVCIGDDFGSSIKTIALLKKLGVQKLYGRESSLIHKTVINALGFSNTINPEYDTAVVFAEKLIMEGVWSIYSITEDIKVAEVSIPEEYVGRRYTDLDTKELEDISILAVKYLDKKLSTPSLDKWAAFDANKIDKDLVLDKEMRLVIKGRKKDILDFLKL